VILVTDSGLCSKLALEMEKFNALANKFRVPYIAVDIYRKEVQYCGGV